MSSPKFRLAVLRAFKLSLPVLLVPIAMIPMRSVINRVFDGTWHVNWRAILTVGVVLSVVFFAFLLVTDLLQGFTKQKRERNGDVQFPGVMWLRGVYLGCIAIGIASSIGSYLQGASWWTSCLFLAFVLLGYFAWPAAIKITDREIRQRRPLGRSKVIPIAEIESANLNPTSGETMVFGKNGTLIIHTGMHVDSDEFAAEIEKRTGKEVTVLGDGIN